MFGDSPKLHNLLASDALKAHFGKVPLHDLVTATLSSEHVEAALDEMLFSGGSLNVKLFGGAVEQ